MKKILALTALVALLVSLSVTSVLAGDQVRGENGEGSVEQNCLNFEYCPYGDENPPPPTP